MDLREIEKIVKEKKGGIIEKKQTLISLLQSSPSSSVEDKEKEKEDVHATSSLDSSTALQLFLDHIPISSLLPFTTSSSVLKFRTQDSLSYAIRTMYDDNVSVASIMSNIEFDPTIVNHSDPYIGIIDFASMVLWFLEECESYFKNNKDDDLGPVIGNGIFSMLDQVPPVAETKIGELAKSNMWHPFFPINSNDTLFHVLLLLSKHQLHLVPIVEGLKSNITGFLMESSVVHLLLQSSGLEWFDNLVDKALSEIRLEKQSVIIYEDQSIAEAMNILWVNRACAVAVLQRETERIIGCIRTSDVYHLLNNDDIFNNRKTMSVDHFIKLETSTEEADPDDDRNLDAPTSTADSDPIDHDSDTSTSTSESDPAVDNGIDASDVDHGLDIPTSAADLDPTNERDLDAPTSTETLALKNKLIPRMDSPITNRTTDTLKQAMETMMNKKSNVSFLVDESQRVKGMLTLRDIIIQFAPPGMDSRITGGSFFEDALEQTGAMSKMKA